MYIPGIDLVKNLPLTVAVLLGLSLLSTALHTNSLNASADENCDPSYPDVCVPSSPPDLNCDDVSYNDIRVVGADPHGFDREGDGIGCES
jgi:hypothetical protein